MGDEQPLGRACVGTGGHSAGRSMTGRETMAGQTSGGRCLMHLVCNKEVNFGHELEIMQTANNIDEIEVAIDNAFAENPISQLPYSQAVWTLLAGAEEIHFRDSVIHPVTEVEMGIVVDGLINALTYPIRIVYKNCLRSSNSISYDLNDENYENCMNWLNNASDYLNFCSVFPLYRRKQLDIDVKGNQLIVRPKAVQNFAYEAYDRFTGKRDEHDAIVADPNALVSTLIGKIHRQGQSFTVKFTRRLVEGVLRVFGPHYESRFMLPGQWNFVHFSITQFKSTMVCLQSLASSWMVARQLFASDGVPGIGYSSSVWVIKKTELESIISRAVKVEVITVRLVLNYLTFGACGVRNPDIAIQPIVDLENGSYAISPLLLMHTNVERNLCVLLNQIPSEKRNYLSLVQEKEIELHGRIVDSLKGTRFDYCSGKVDATDIDIAIIDRKAKVCLCVELKWFIEPAEIREVEERSEEIAKGIRQTLKITELFESQDKKLFSVLKIDESYNFQAIVGSENFIGRDYIQDENVPVLKVWHLISHLANGDLKKTVDWLRNREYLPKEDQDFEVRKMPISVGKWRAEWYGLRPVESQVQAAS